MLCKKQLYKIDKVMELISYATRVVMLLILFHIISYNQQCVCIQRRLYYRTN